MIGFLVLIFALASFETAHAESEHIACLIIDAASIAREHHGDAFNALRADAHRNVNVSPRTQIRDIIRFDGVNDKNNEGYTPLYFAIDIQDESFVRELLTKGADVNMSDNRLKISPLLKAVLMNNYGIASLLLERGAFVNVQDIEGNTPLHAAVQKNAIDMVALLLQFGAKHTIKNNQGWDVVHFARYYNNAAALNLLKGASAFNRACKVVREKAQALVGAVKSAMKRRHSQEPRVQPEPWALTFSPVSPVQGG